MSREHEELLKNFSSLSEWMKHVNNTATTVKTGLLKTTYETLLADLTRLNSEIQLLQTARSTYNRILVGNDLINDTIKQINDNVDWMDNVDYKEQEIVDADSKATAVIEVGHDRLEERVDAKLNLLIGAMSKMMDDYAQLTKDHNAVVYRQKDHELRAEHIASEAQRAQEVMLEIVPALGSQIRNYTSNLSKSSVFQKDVPLKVQLNGLKYDDAYTKIAYPHVGTMQADPSGAAAFVPMTPPNEVNATPTRVVGQQTYGGSSFIEGEKGESIGRAVMMVQELAQTTEKVTKAMAAVYRNGAIERLGPPPEPRSGSGP